MQRMVDWLEGTLRRLAAVSAPATTRSVTVIASVARPAVVVLSRQQNAAFSSTAEEDAVLLTAELATALCQPVAHQQTPQHLSTSSNHHSQFDMPLVTTLRPRPD